VSLRLFTAVDLPAAARAQLATSIEALRDSLRRAGMDEAFRWVPPANLHLTLRFLGNMDAEAAARIRAAMTERLQQEASTIRLGRLGTFPPRGRPRVLHAAVEEGGEWLAVLRDALDARLAPVCRWEPETRPFAPHLTIARCRDRAHFDPAEFSRLIGAAHWPPVALQVGEVTLFSSRTLPAGPEYSAEARAALGSG
jgi:RNA 2',3'-cyclic 3'-phosphodiesterase